MKIILSKELELDLIKVGLYQIVGGCIGIAITLWNVFRSPLLTGLMVILILLFLLFFAYSIYCGVLCIKTNKNALKLSLINQMLQLVSIAILGVTYNYISGFFVSIGLDLTDKPKFIFNGGISTFEFSLKHQIDRFEISFNIVALILLFWVGNIMDKVKAEIKIRELN